MGHEADASRQASAESGIFSHKEVGEAFPRWRQVEKLAHVAAT
jgi:hypothetical protein